MRHGLMAGIFLAVFGMAWALTPDATREQVLAELGKPTSVAKLGKREILIYPKGVRLELEEGKVVAAKGIALSDEVVAEPVAPGKPAKAVVVKNEKDDDDEPVLSEKERKPMDAENAAAEKEYAAMMAKSQAEMEKAVEGLEKSHELGQQPAPPREFDGVAFSMEVGLKFLLTVAGLKLACKYWGAEVFWRGIFTVAGADVLVRWSMAYVGEALLGFPSLLHADELVAVVVMVLLLRKVSINHAIAQAIEVALTTKIFTIVVGTFLITVILRMMN